MAAETTAHGPDLTLGFFSPRFGTHQGGILDNYPEALWTGIAQAAQEDDANVICFVGADLNPPTPYYKNWNVIYDLASPTVLDGLIIPTAIMQQYVTVKDVADFCARYTSIPTLSIGLKLEGIPSITIDNFNGMGSLMDHLINVHRYQRIALISGPLANEEAEARYRAYTTALHDHGIPFDSDLIAMGHFTLDDGVEAVKLFLDERKVDLDAIVACNDNMAIGAYQALTERGLSIPEDIAVTGFDDIPQARTFSTPLTSVRQPLAEMGRQAAHMLMEHLRCGAALEDLTLGTELVVRESCGCLPVVTVDLAHARRNFSEHTAAQERTRLLAGLEETLCSHFPEISSQEVEKLVVSFFDELEGMPKARFLSTFNRLLRTSTMSLTDAALGTDVMSWWQLALSILRRQAQLHIRDDTARHMEDVLYQGSALVTKVAERAYSNVRERAELRVTAQSGAIRDIHAESDVWRVVDVLARNLPVVDIHSCFLALYEGGTIPSPTSRLIMAYHNGQQLKLAPGGLLFPSEQLIPPEGLSGRMPPFLMIRPLGMHTESFGFIAMEMSMDHQTVADGTNDEFVEQISSALYGAILRRQIEQSNQHLQQRAAELVEVNTQLERFAYIISHDLQEPLRMVASYLQLIERRYKDRLDSDGEEFIGYAVDGAMRMKRMINDILAYSRVSTHEHPQELVSCEELLGEALSNLEVAIEDSDALITHDPLPDVMADRTQLSAVFQNLLGNAIKFRSGRQPQVHISAEQRKDQWLFSVKDNGIGIAPQYTEQVFALFSRLHPHDRYPGSGIGLAICKKVVEHHGGRIWLESQPGEGTTFFFTMPLPNKD
jgi:signal transduction histidine kinase/DNA-binding LacI/PurR family transcriptional regulator